MTEYVKECFNFLMKASKDLHLTEYQEIEFSGEQTNYRVSVQACLFGHTTYLPNLLDTTMHFIIFDAFIEQGNQNLEGLSFRQKYLALPQNTNVEIMIKQVYRILKNYRNASVHSFSSINDDGSFISFSYTFKTTTFRLKISNESLKLIQSFICLYMRSIGSIYSDKYIEYLLSDIYYSIISGIHDFNDEDGPIPSFSAENKIYWISRFVCKSEKPVEENGKLKFPIRDEYFQPKKYPIDFHFCYKSVDYILPIEMLDVDKTIESTTIELFKKIV